MEHCVTRWPCELNTLQIKKTRANRPNTTKFRKHPIYLHLKRDASEWSMLVVAMACDLNYLNGLSVAVSGNVSWWDTRRVPAVSRRIY